MVSKTIWRLPEVISHTGLPRSTIYLKMKLDEFPQSIKLGLRSVGWNSDDVEQWIQDRIDESRGEN
jgi:prophage regulatory protein